MHYIYISHLYLHKSRTVESFVFCMSVWVCIGLLTISWKYSYFRLCIGFIKFMKILYVQRKNRQKLLLVEMWWCDWSDILCILYPPKIKVTIYLSVYRLPCKHVICRQNTSLLWLSFDANIHKNDDQLTKTTITFIYISHIISDWREGNTAN